MYNKQSLISYPYILKLTLWLLLGCSIAGNKLYANKPTPKEYINACRAIISELRRNINQNGLRWTINELGLIEAKYPLMVLGTFWIGLPYMLYKLYKYTKRSYSKETKGRTTPAAPACWQKGWLCFILSLLFMIGIFYFWKKKRG